MYWLGSWTGKGSNKLTEGGLVCAELGFDLLMRTG